MQWPAVPADVNKISAFRRASEVKEHGVGVEKANIAEPLPSVEQSTAETLNIDLCLTSRLFEGQKRWRNRVFCGHFKTFVNCGFSASAKKHRSLRTVILMH
jgi:hypothetical protein